MWTFFSVMGSIVGLFVLAFVLAFISFLIALIGAMTMFRIGRGYWPQKF